MNGLLSIGPLMWQRLVANWRLLLVLAFGILVAATLLAISPVYTRVMNDLGLQESLAARIQGYSRNGFDMVPTPLGDPEAIQQQKELAQAISEEIGWFTQSEVRFGSLPTMNLLKGGQLAPTSDEPVLVQFQGITHVEDHVKIVEGRAAQATDDPTKLEAVVPVEAAAFMNASIGDTVESTFTYDDCNRPPAALDPEQAQENQRFRCTPQTFVDVHLTATIVGFVERTDVDDPFWSTGSISFDRPMATEDHLAIVPVVFPEETFFQALPKLLPSFPSEFRLYGMIDASRLNSANLSDAQASLARLKQRIQDAGAIPDLSTASPLSSFQNRASFNQVTLLLLLIQVVGIAVYYVMLVSTLLAERRSEEIAMLRSRGATVGQLVAMSAAEAFALGLVAAFIAPFVASGAIAALGKTSTFDSISGGHFLPLTIVPMSFVFALGGAAIAAVAVVIPAFFSARRGMVLFLRASVRPGQPLLQRYYLDFAIVGLAAFALWQLNQRGSVFDPDSVGGWSADPLLLLSPLLLILAIGAMMFRFLPLILRLVTKLVATTAGPGVTLGLWQLTRSPARYNQLALLVVMAAAVGTFAATYGETTDRSQEDRALYAAGADVRLTGLGRLQVGFSPEAADKLEAVPGVDHAVTATRQQMAIGPLPNFGDAVDVLGVDPQGAPDVLWWRNDFANKPLQEMLRRLEGSPIQSHGIPLPGEPVTATIWVNPIGARPNTTLWLRTEDANGIFRYTEFGVLDFEGYRQLTATFDAAFHGIQYPISAVAIMMTQQRSLNDPTRDVFLDDFAIQDANGQETMIEDFEGSFRWETIRTATRDRDTVQQVSNGAHDGSGAAQFTFLSGTGAEIRGMTVTDPSIPLPALASNYFMQQTGLVVGGEIDLVYGKLLLPITIQGVVDYFPTMYNSGAGYVIVNQNDLFYYAGVTSDRAHSTVPTEAWLSLTSDPSARKEVESSFLDRFGIPSSQIVDSQTILNDVRTDPVARAGGSGILLVALVAAFAILALGFSLTLYLGGQARTVEVSVMRAVGISPRQLFTMISLEYLLIAGVGLAIGTLAGLRISRTMLSFLNVTDSGSRVVPSFDLITRWDTVGIAFAAVGVAFLVGVTALASYFLRLPVSRILRLTR
jgi:ABC-type antimicrobial peptide transport system permease subunit